MWNWRIAAALGSYDITWDGGWSKAGSKDHYLLLTDTPAPLLSPRVTLSSCQEPWTLLKGGVATSLPNASFPSSTHPYLPSSAQLYASCTFEDGDCIFHFFVSHTLFYIIEHTHTQSLLKLWKKREKVTYVGNTDMVTVTSLRMTLGNMLRCCALPHNAFRFSWQPTGLADWLLISALKQYPARIPSREESHGFFSKWRECIRSENLC